MLEQIINTRFLCFILAGRVRYEIVDREYVISENLNVDVETYDTMRMRPFKDANYFRRDAIGLMWTDRELAHRCLNLTKCEKAIPELRLAEANKINLVKGEQFYKINTKKNIAFHSFFHSNVFIFQYFRHGLQLVRG